MLLEPETGVTGTDGIELCTNGEGGCCDVGDWNLVLNTVTSFRTSRRASSSAALRALAVVGAATKYVILLDVTSSVENSTDQVEISTDFCKPAVEYFQ